jgi:Putative transposase
MIRAGWNNTASRLLRQRAVLMRWSQADLSALRREGLGRYKTMTLSTHEFIRRFLMHVLPKGVHRIRHYGLFANGNRAANIARARELLAVPPRVPPHETDCTAESEQPRVLPKPCPCCGGRMIIIETFARGCQPRHRPTPAPPIIRIDTS